MVGASQKSVLGKIARREVPAYRRALTRALEVYRAQSSLANCLVNIFASNPTGEATSKIQRIEGR